MKLHGSLYLSESEARADGADVNGFLKSWENVLRKEDKFELFKSMFIFPLPTVPFNDKLWSVFEKVFHGIDPVFHYDFLTPEIAAEDAEYRKKNPPINHMRRVFDTAKGGRINCLQKIDLPPEQVSERPDITQHSGLLPIQSIEAYEYDPQTGSMEWACWKETDETLAFFDRYSYRTFPLKKGTVEITGEAITDNPHGLVNNDGSPRCPVEFAWCDSINPAEPDMKESPVSKWLSEMFWLLGYRVSEKNNDLVAMFPIFWAYESGCDYVEENEERGIYVSCDNGLLRTGDGQLMFDNFGKNCRCPKCGERRMIGPGTLVKKPPPDDGQPFDGNAPVGVIPAEVNSVKIVAEKIAEMMRRITVDVTGVEPDTLNRQAVNADQIGKAVDAMETSVKNFQHNLEKALEWWESTRCQLMYGEQFQGVSISLGTRYLFLAPEDLLSLYEKHRAAGADAAILDRLWEDWNGARYKKDPSAMERARLLLHLDPFRHRTFQEVKSLGTVDPVLVYLKFNFSSLIARFERENGPVTQYMPTADFAKRVEIIQEALKNYGKESITTESTGTTAGGSPNDGV